MPKRRADADGRQFLDEFLCVKIPRLRAMGVVQLDAPHAIIQVGDRQKLIGLAHTKFRNGGSWSHFRCPTCGRRTNRLWLIEDRPLCRYCCEGMGIVHRSKWRRNLATIVRGPYRAFPVAKDPLTGGWGGSPKGGPALSLTLKLNNTSRK
jgi:hypothetical protein